VEAPGQLPSLPPPLNPGIHSVLLECNDSLNIDLTHCVVFTYKMAVLPPPWITVCSSLHFTLCMQQMTWSAN